MGPTADQSLAAKRAAWDRDHGLKPGEYDNLTPQQRAKLEGAPTSDLEADRAKWDAEHGLKAGEYDKLSDTQKAKLEEPPVPVDPKIRATHPPVLASPGQVCQVRGCGFIFGDPAFGTEPHPTTLVILGKPIPNVEPPRPTPPAPKVSTAKCEPIGAQNTCPKCNWNAATSMEPHPVL